MNPVEQFKRWYEAQTDKSSVAIPSACCLTSIGIDGYPNSRFVSLKEILDDKFIITGSLNSRKGIELLSSPKASLTFWWTETERQIRIQGDAVQIENELAEKYFQERSRDSQIVTELCEQGAITKNIELLKAEFKKRQITSRTTKISRPTQWSGFYIIPKRIEFMQFKTSRFHFRELYSLEKGSWTRVILQP